MTVKFLTGDALAVLRTLPTGSVQACITSPPYMGLRDYGTGTWAGGDAACDHQRSNGQGVTGQRADRTFTAHVPYRDKCGKCGAIRTDHQIGLEPTIDAYVAALVEVMREVRRVLHDSGVALVNLGDSARDKQLLMLPARVALALQADGWVLRSMMPWVKKSAMPESVTDRPASAVEYVFLLAKRSRYFWDAAAIMRASTDDVPRYRPTYRGGGAYTQGRSYHNSNVTAPTSGADIPNATGTRNFRNSDLFYDSLDAPPYGLISDHAGEPLAMDVNPEAFPSAHFATYPTRLVDPLIRAATSERGCCAACGGPWVRTMGDAYQVPGRGAGNGFARPQQLSRGGRGDETPWMPKGRDTLGWRQSCTCPAAPPVPQTVIDPFSGAGTTCLCAHRLGRDAIGVELNHDYVAMARARLEADAGMFAAVDAYVAPLPVPDAPQCELFATLVAAQ